MVLYMLNYNDDIVTYMFIKVYTSYEHNTNTYVYLYKNIIGVLKLNIQDNIV